MPIATTFAIGTSVVGLATLDSLGIVDPKSSFQPYSAAYKGADGIKKGQGYAKAIWHWDLIHAAERATIRAYITGLGGNLYIRMPDNEGTWHVFQANMAWTENEEDQFATRTLDLPIEFTHLINIP